MQVGVGTNSAAASRIHRGRLRDETANMSRAQIMQAGRHGACRASGPAAASVLRCCSRNRSRREGAARRTVDSTARPRTGSPARGLVRCAAPIRRDCSGNIRHCARHVLNNSNRCGPCSGGAPGPALRPSCREPSVELPHQPMTIKHQHNRVEAQRNLNSQFVAGDLDAGACLRYARQFPRKDEPQAGDRLRARTRRWRQEVAVRNATRRHLALAARNRRRRARVGQPIRCQRSARIAGQARNSTNSGTPT